MEIAPVSTVSLPPTDYKAVPRGNTQINVNREVLRYLLERSGLGPASRALDAPCGKGEFLAVLRRCWPGATLAACDLLPEGPPVPGLRYQQTDLTQPFDLSEGQPFDLVTSISGVMMFGNTRNFVASCAAQLRPGGVLIMTNDNILAMRDRVSYLLLGRVRHFPLLFDTDENMPQLVQQQELKRLFEVNDVELQEVIYTALYPKDWLFMPLALLLYPVQWLYLRRLPHGTSQKLRHQMFGLSSLLKRHYIFIGRKRAG
ncbi:class I SAM-dependent methyltransferase [Hymenobacter caeli]|uniref:SAM-dependent methyltransferase n=1 Tax=Hymenobacter caeli TaxID=2735894 RepID=A0ABX2FW88_9BACT|nr:class I SAM-dependent methyltransferase [Hymenobacter caeli]NRT21419.1 SAM-dependent methyltransferase [Hymenobacter caeli]